MLLSLSSPANESYEYEDETVSHFDSLKHEGTHWNFNGMMASSIDGHAPMAK